MKDYHSRDGRAVGARWPHKMIDRMIRWFHVDRPANVLTFPPGMRLSTLGQLGLAESDFAEKLEELSK
ncbi:MAG: hypothetical protein OES09_02775 [Gammaproteobacteria bacterium]|nr:hypothetical protein [Gammaproteobacteria bacterium]